MHTAIVVLKSKLRIPKFHKIVSPGRTEVTIVLRLASTNNTKNHSQFELKYRHLSIIATSTIFLSESILRKLENLTRFFFKEL